MNSWFSSFFIDNMRTDNKPDALNKYEFMGTRQKSNRPLPSLFTPEEINYVLKATMGVLLLGNVDFIEKGDHCEYNPKKFPAVIMKMKEPKATALIFKSGKMVCTGAKSEEDSHKAARKFASIIRKLGFNVGFSGFKIENIVASADLKFKISLEGLACNLRSCSYEPESFPGLIFRMGNPKIVLLIFYSGKMILTGAKRKEQIYEGLGKIYPVLLNYKSKWQA